MLLVSVVAMEVGGDCGSAETFQRTVTHSVFELKDWSRAAYVSTCFPKQQTQRAEASHEDDPLVVGAESPTFVR